MVFKLGVNNWGLSLLVMLIVSRLEEKFKKG
ncbi:Uncharacterised protein [Streptococcus pneumoniae]|nr:Uncharacterised protein [Streptococcus pneumoniae]